MAAISKQLEELLLLLRSRHGKEENLKIDSIPTSPQLPESRDVSRPEPKPSYVINATPDVTKASSPLSNRTIKRHQRISFEEIDKRRLNGLCLFCEESETPDHYLRHKNSGILMIDCDENQTLNDEELVETEVATESIETEVATESIETEHGTVKREANASMILANLEDESMPPFQVPVSDSKILRNVEKIEVDGDVEKGQKLLRIEKICCAHKVFAKMSQHKETLGMKKKQKGFKSWRFKFKHRVAPRELIQEKLVVHEAKVTRNQLRSLIGIVDDLHSDCGSDIWCVQYLVNSVVVGDLQETQWLFNDELEDIQKLQIVIKEGINSYACPEFNGICLRSHILHQQKKPKSFLEFEVMREDVQHVLWASLHMKAIETRYAIGECDEICEVARDVSKRSMLGLTFGIRESNAGQEQQAVCEQIIMLNVWLNQISLVLQQVRRNKRIRLSKRWWFKYRFDEEDQGSLQSRAGYSLSRREMLTFISQAKALLFESKGWREKQIPTLQINVSQCRWTQEVFVVIRFLLRRRLHLNFNCEEPELVGRKRNHGLFIRLDSKQKQRKCPKSWMFKFKMGSKPAANWSPQMHIWSTSYRVWHRWKARCFYVGMISTMRAWLFGEEGFDIGKRSDELEDTWTAKIRSWDQRLRSFRALRL